MVPHDNRERIEFPNLYDYFLSFARRSDPQRLGLESSLSPDTPARLGHKKVLKTEF